MLSAARKLSFSIVGVSLALHLNVSAATQVVFGPKNYSPGLLKPTDVTEQFSSAPVVGTIKVINGDGKDVVIPTCSGNVLKKLLCETSNLLVKTQLLLTRPTSFSVELNNSVVVSQSNLPLHKGSISLPVTLKAQNKARIRVAGLFLSKISVEVNAPTGAVNQSPIASMQLSHSQGFAPLTVTANGMASTDPDGAIVDFAWDFGDGSTSSGMIASHIYTTPGSYQVRLTVKDNNGASNTQNKQVLVLQNQIPTADLRLASSGTGLAPLMVMFDGSRSKDPENGLLRYFWNFGDGSAVIEGRPNETHEFVNAGLYTVVLTVRDENGGQAQSSVSVEVKVPVLPPAPETIAPPLADIAYPTFEDKISFLYTGANPIQTGVNIEAIDPKRLSVIRGKVLDGEGLPLAGVTVKLLNETDFGQTLSRENGEFDLAFNSGSYVNIEYSKNGYVLVQRKLSVDGQNYYSAEDVRLTKLDPIVTKIALNSTEAQVAQGSKQVDSSGERTGTVIFPPQTQATIVMADGSTKVVPELDIRVTEFTVGENGQQKMPASLPAHSAYTYAAEISADQAIALGGKTIKFNKPVSYYVENFLNLPVGSAVPLGSYDTVKGYWVPQPDGLVIKILSRTSDGVAQLDLGNNRVATSGELASLNFNESELKNLAKTYSDGATLWRVATNHFSAVDLNFVKSPDQNIENNSDLESGKVDPKIAEGQCKGCVINVESAVMQESIEIPGVDFKLTYSTDRVPGRKVGGLISGEITGSVVPTELLRIEVDLNIAGRTIKQTYPPFKDAQFRYNWDGYDAYGRTPPDTVIAIASVKYVYSEFYNILRYTGGTSFGDITPEGTIVKGRGENYFIKNFSIPVRASQRLESAAAKSVANGWFITSHHTYDPRQNALFKGDGTNLILSSLPWVYQSIAGTGVPGFSGDNGLARFAQLNSPSSVVTASDGTVFIADRGNNRIRKIDLNGVITTIAGNGMAGFSGDNGPADDATLNKPQSITVNRDGSYYIVDTGNHCIRFVDENATISTFAGVCGQVGYTSGVKTEALLNSPKDIVLSGDGSIYISDTGNHSIRRISPTGELTTISGSGQPGDAVNLVQSLAAQYREPRISNIDPSGSIFIADKGNNLIRRLSPGGVVKTIVGNGRDDEPQFFKPASEFNLVGPKVVAAVKSGEVYFTDDYYNTISFFDLNGWVNPLVGYRTTRDPLQDDYATGSTARIVDIQGISINSDGTKMFADAGLNKVSTFSPVKPEFRSGLYTIPSEDGSEVFVFDSLGKHLRTLYGKTGAVKLSFEYDNENYLAGIADAFGNRTVFNRSGKFLTSIVGPYGHTTVLGVDASGYLSRVTTPVGAVTEIAYYGDQEGLISSFKKPNGNTSGYSYNDVGELVRESNPMGGWQQLTKPDAFNIHYRSGEGKIFDIWTQTDEDGYEKFTEDARGAQRYETVYSGSTSNADSDGSYDESTTLYDTRSRGMTTFVAHNMISSLYSAPIIQKVTREYQFPSGNYFDYILKEKMTNEKNNVTERTYVSATRTEVLKTPAGREVSKVIDQNERTTSVQSGSIVALRMEYDSRGRISSFKQDERETKFSYDSFGRLYEKIDPIGRKYYFQYDSNNRVTKQAFPDGHEVEYTYDLNGNRTALKPPERNSHQFDFSGLDLLTRYKPNFGSSTNSVSFDYSTDRELRTTTRADGIVVRNFYSPGTRRLIESSTADGLQFKKFTYGNLDRKIYFIDSSDSVKMSLIHDAFLPTSLNYTGPLVAAVANEYGGSAYGGPAHLSAQNVVGSRVEFEYDADQTLVKAGRFEIDRNENLAVSGARLGNVSEKYSYNKFGEVVERVVHFGNTELFAEKYTRDNISRITSKETSVEGFSKIVNYGYDLRGRLNSVNDSVSGLRSYLFDGQGNRVGAGFQYDAEDRLLKANSITYSYRPDGELASKIDDLTGETTRYSYDVFGSLKKVILPSGSTISYITDGLDRRIVKLKDGVIQNKFVRNTEGQLIAELNPDNSLKSHFIYLSRGDVPDGMRMGGVDYYFVKDHLGSIRLVVNSDSGAVVQALDYDEFGVVKLDTNPALQPFGFAGGIYDSESKLVRFGARDYDPEVGRWTSKDPILFAGGDTNLFVYVQNDPINLTDPSGLKPGDEFSSPGEAAGDAIMYINPVSGSLNQEHGGYIYRNANGSYSATVPVGGTSDGLTLGPAPAGAVADYHTHGAYDPRYFNEGFSFADIWTNATNGRDGYLGTPAGSIQQNINGNISQVRTCPQ